MQNVGEPIHLGVSDIGPTNPQTNSELLRAPVVFSHGWLDDRHSWDAVVADVSDSFRCLSWDLRGHGESDSPPPGNYTRSDALGDLGRIVNSAGPPVVLAGHSLGGYLSLAYTLSNPSEVEALILVAAGPGFRNPDARDQWNESVDASAAKAEVPAGSEEISKHVDSWVIDSLGEIQSPALVIVGEHDKRFQASAAVFEKNLDVRANEVIGDAGHRVHVKQPTQVGAHIRAFLETL